MKAIYDDDLSLKAKKMGWGGYTIGVVKKKRVLINIWSASYGIITLSNGNERELLQ